MIVSRCCKEKVYVQCGGECTSYYVCTKCGKACDTMTPLEYLLPKERMDAEVQSGIIF